MTYISCLYMMWIGGRGITNSTLMFIHFSYADSIFQVFRVLCPVLYPSSLLNSAYHVLSTLL